MDHRTKTAKKGRVAINLPLINQNQSSNVRSATIKKHVKWADQDWKEKMKAECCIQKLEDKSLRTR